MPTRLLPGTEEAAELDRVLTSHTFERSEKLRRFLKYVCELTLRGEGARINEYLIGNEVFDRGPDYSPSEDSVVRRQAHALRHKLQEYYAEEGRDAPIRIELPVGKYVPVFRRPEAEAVGISSPITKPHPQSWRIWGLALAGGVLLFAAGWVVGFRGAAFRAAGGAAPQIPAVVQEIWGPWFADPAGVVICFSNPMTTVVKHFQTELPPDAVPHRFRFSGPADRVVRQAFGLGSQGHLYFQPVMNQGKLGEAIGAVYLAALLSHAGLPVRTTQSRFLSWEDLRSENLILLGHNEANPWLDPVLEKYPLRLVATDGGSPRHIENQHPGPGEPAKYAIEFSEQRNEGDQEYALVSMIPGVDGRHNLLLISGLNASVTEMAASFLTDPATLEELLGRLRAAAPGHRGRWYFQIVLRAEVHDKVATKASLLTVRVL